jgi:hypothetical protein
VLGAYLGPLTAAPEAVAAMAGDADVRVESSPTRIVLTPRAAPRAGLVFLPSGKVDPRAYVPLLRQVSAAGYLVVVVKEPTTSAFSPSATRPGLSPPRPASRAGRSAATASAGSPPGSRCRRATRA